MVEERFTLQRAQDYISKSIGNVNDQFKPEKHLTAPVGWINDPNGFVYFRGEYHLFYQYYPYDSSWGPMHWGHVKSTDLLHWEQLPVALAPDMAYDKDGCFSGSAIVKDDRLWLMYTGHIVEEDGSIRQVQNMAVSEDGISFTKLTSNPVMTGDSIPEISSADFRDPKLFEKDGHFYAVVATKHVDQVGCIVLLGSTDLENWSFESIFLKGTTDQGIMWECPDYFNLKGQDCLIMSPMKFPQSGQDFQNLNSNIICFGHVDWSTKTFVLEKIDEIDHGHDFYAAQSLEDNQGRRIMIAWMQAWGRKIPTQDLNHNWAGMMTLARELTIVDGQLVQTPFLPGKGRNTVELSQGDLWEEELKSPSRLDLISEEHASWTLTIGGPYDYIRLSLENNQLTLDRSGLENQLGGEETSPLLKRSVQLPNGVNELTLFIDKSAFEVFANKGKISMTSTFYAKVNTAKLTVQTGISRLQY
ncbi:glycoside hydrolase family 32 protein [Streptococcus moroccensis]|uniref:Sucrose-6-phosphate hydrolase n=1 Tax=Streptococcus moroccensis TaxID=1451356 RepID=A0ABT9YRY3_9STRE|nr:glycoside hydrolase family 32 protein [Streptococcus moroccensis]MDQ0221870.1 beta-fructofuranosidase [Streptococcus moroccensis]